MKRRIGLLFTLICCASSLVGCNKKNPEPTPSTKSVANITATGAKTNYTVGEKFSTDGLVVTAIYTDYTSAVVPSGYTWTPSGALTVNDKKVTISYMNVSTDIAITVTSTPSKTLTSITVTGAKTTYTVGETFSTTGMTVTANYSDKSSKVVTDYTVSNTKPLTVNDKSIKITYQTVSKTIDITVTEADPLADIIEWKYDVHLKVPNGQTWLRKYKFTGGETYYMRRHSGSQSFYISVQYPDGTYLEGYNRKFISATTITSWTFCIAKTSWVKITIANENTSSGQTSIYWYDY